MPVRPKPVATSSQIRNTPCSVAQLAHRAQVAVGLHEDARRALHQRLHDHRGDLVAVLVEQRVAGRRRRPARPASARTAAAGRASGRARCRRPTPSRWCRRGSCSRRQTNSVAPPLAALVPVLEGHLQRDLARRSSRCRSRRRGSARRGASVDEPLGQLDRAGGWREAEHRRVGDPVELVAHRGVDARVAVAVDVAPQRRDAVDVARGRRCRTASQPSARSIDRRRPRRSSPAAG